MQKEFVTYEIALALKELGFNETCFASITLEESPYIPSKGGFYKNSEMLNNYTVACPLWQQATDWIRECTEINCMVGYSSANNGNFMAILDFPNGDCDYDMNPLKSYINCMKISILRAIELIKNKK